MSEYYKQGVCKACHQKSRVDVYDWCEDCARQAIAEHVMFPNDDFEWPVCAYCNEPVNKESRNWKDNCDREPMLNQQPNQEESDG